MDINRKTAFDILCEIEDDGAYSNLSVNRHIRKNKPESQSFVRGLTYGVLENKILLDTVLSQYVKSPLAKVRTKPLIILRMGLYQLLFMDNVPDYASIDESVKLAKKTCYGQSGFINAVLRSFLRNDKKFVLPDPEKENELYLSQKYSYDESIVRLWSQDYGSANAEEMLQTGNEVPPLSIRVNKLKTTADELEGNLREHGFGVVRSDSSEISMHVKGASALNSEEYNQGLFSVQDESSVLAIKSLDPKPGEIVIDVCAAPGGKACCMAEMMGNKGRIIAWDIHPHKIDIINANASRLGIEIIEAGVHDSTVIDEEFVGIADKVLADVPCLGLGVVRRKPEIKYKKIDEIIEEITELQLQILIASAQYVKKGGHLLYSTCSVSKRENSLAVRNFLNVFSDFVVEDERQIFLGKDGMDGFYYCNLRRI